MVLSQEPLSLTSPPKSLADIDISPPPPMLPPNDFTTTKLPPSPPLDSHHSPPTAITPPKDLNTNGPTSSMTFDDEFGSTTTIPPSIPSPPPLQSPLDYHHSPLMTMTPPEDLIADGPTSSVTLNDGFGSGTIIPPGDPRFGPPTTIPPGGGGTIPKGDGGFEFPPTTIPPGGGGPSPGTTVPPANSGLGSGTTISPHETSPPKEVTASSPPSASRPVDSVTSGGTTLAPHTTSSLQDSTAEDLPALVTFDDGFGSGTVIPPGGIPPPGLPGDPLWLGTTIPPGGVPVPDAFKQVDFVLVGQKGTDTTIEVGIAPTQTTAAPPPRHTTTTKSINDFNRPKEESWSFVANTIATNINALAALSRFLEAEVVTMNHPKWAANSAVLTKILDAAVTATDHLCKDVVTTLSASKSS